MSNLLLNFSVTNPSVDYVYSDLAIPVRYNSSSDMVQIKDVESIRNSVRNLFNWQIGERILIPQYGNNLRDILYSKMTPLTEKNIATNIRQMFKWEPRVAVRDIKIEANVDNNQYNVVVYYEIPRINRQESIAVTLQIVE